MEDQTCTIVQDFLHVKLAKIGIVMHNDNTRTVDPVAATMDALSDKFEKWYEARLMEVPRYLNASVDTQCLQSTFESVTENLFQNGISWEQIVTMFSFSSFLYCFWHNYILHFMES